MTRVITILHGHVTNSQNGFEMENLKELSHFKECDLTSHFVLGVGAGHLS
jgi:hypothetical protein